MWEGELLLIVLEVYILFTNIDMPFNFLQKIERLFVPIDLITDINQCTLPYL